MLKDEGALQDKVLRYVGELPAGLWENRSPGPFGRKGVPDVTSCYRGRFVAIELKHPRHHGPPLASDKRWPAQRLYLRAIYLSGGFALATNDFERVAALILHIDQRVDEFGISFSQPTYWEHFT